MQEQHDRTKMNRTKDAGFFYVIKFGDGAEYMVEAFNSRACAIAAFVRVRDGSGDNHLSLTVASGRQIERALATGAFTIDDAIRT